MKKFWRKTKKLLLFLLCLSFAAGVVLYQELYVQSSIFSVSSKGDKIIEMQYDDYFDGFEYKKIKILNKGNPISYKVGYGVDPEQRDDAVVKLEKGVLHATGVGKALVTIDGVEYTVVVEPASISMFFMIGQSNMYGCEGDAGQSVVNKNGTAYSTCGIAETLTAENAAQFVPSALSGDGAKVNVLGNKKGLSENPVNSLTEMGDGKMGLDSAFAHKWYEITGEKVWLINAGHTGKAINKWIKGGSEYQEAVALFKAAQQVMQNEILAGHYVLSEYGYFWFHGCSDRPNTAAYYVENFLSMHMDLKNELAFDFDADGEKEVFEFCDVIMPRAGVNDCVGYRNGVYTDYTDAVYEQSFYDLEMRGQRVALYWLVNNPEYKDINLVCNIGDRWAIMPDGSDTVKEYFAERYPNGTVTYTTQKKQSDEWYTPTTTEDVHDNAHYNQIGYNELGFEAALNSAYTHGKAEKPTDVETTVTFYDWTGYKQVSAVKASAYGQSSTLVVPVVYPVYESKNVVYLWSDNLKYEFYDLTSSIGTQGGTLKSYGASVNKTVTVKGKADFEKGNNSYYWLGTNNGLVVQTDDGYLSNSLSVVAFKDKESKIENGLYTDTIYKISNTVNLLHNHRWSIEWAGSTGKSREKDFSFLLLSESLYASKRVNNDVKYIWIDNTTVKNCYGISIGSNTGGAGGYTNSGLNIKKAINNPTEYHTYKLYNVINADGTNCIRLSVDGEYCGTFEGFSGKDFMFNYIGARHFEINNYKINYLKIHENS